MQSSARRENALASAAAAQLGWVLDEQLLQTETNASYALPENWVVAKIGDLGTAVQLPPDEIAVDSSIVKQGLVVGECGTTGYVAPEVLRGDAYGVAADMFSVLLVG